MNRNTLCLIISLLILIFGGCRKHAPSQSIDSQLSIITDSISAGNLRRAAQLADSLSLSSLAAGDSLSHFRFRLSRGVVDFYSGNLSSTLAIADSALAFSLPHSADTLYRSAIKTAARMKGSYYQQFDFNPDSAITYQQLALDYTDPNRADDYILAVSNLADAYKLSSRFADATDLYHRGIHHADSIGVSDLTMEPLLSGIAGTYSAMGEFDEAALWWKRVFRLYPQMGDYARFTNLTNLGNHYYKAGDYDASLRTFRRLEHFLDSIGASDWERNFCDVNKADLFVVTGNTDSAKLCLDRVLPYFERVQPSSTVLAHIHNIQMRYYARRGNYARVEELIEQHPVNDTLRDEQLLARLEVMEDYFRSTSQWQEALRCADSVAVMRDSLLSLKVRQSIADRRMAYERDTHLLQLRADNSRSRERIFRLWMILGFSLAAVAALIVALMVVRRRNAAREAKALRDVVNLRLESVRNRITPHFIYNLLNSELVAREKGLPSRLDAIVRLMRRQQLFVERLVVPLSEELEFLKDYVSLQAPRSQAPFEFELSVAPDVNPESTLVPSMSLQMLAENAFKHGFPSLAEGETRSLSVLIERVGEKVVMRVANNLNTTTPATLRSEGLGLKILYRTIDYLNHTYKVNISLEAGIRQPDSWLAVLQISSCLPSNL